MHAQVVFERAVLRHVEHAFVPLLDRVDEFDIGKVLVLHEKPQWYKFWGRKELDFSSLPLKRLLVEDERDGFSYKTESSVLFDQSSDSSNRVVQFDLDLDAELKTAWGELGGDIGGKGKKLVNLTTNFGRLDHIRSDLFKVLSEKEHTLNLTHPVIADAMQKGHTLFVITSVYKAEKCEVTVSEEVNVSMTNTDTEGQPSKSDDPSSELKDSKSSDDTPKDGGGDASKDADTAKVAESGGATATDSTPVKAKFSGQTGADSKGVSVSSREQPTVVAFEILRVNIGKLGQVHPLAKSGFTHHHKIHAPYGDVFVDIEDQPAPSGGATPTPATDGKKDESKSGDADKSSESKDKPSGDDAAEDGSSKDEKKA